MAVGDSIRAGRKAAGRKNPQGKAFLREQKNMRNAQRMSNKANAKVSKKQRNNGKGKGKEPNRIGGVKNTTGGFYV